MRAAATLLGFALLAYCAHGMDHVYTREGKILACTILSAAGETVRFRLDTGEERELPRGEVVAIEREETEAEPYVITETDSGRLLMGADKLVRAGDAALKAADDPAGSSDNRNALYAEARQAYERALVCLARLVELYPDLEGSVSKRMVATRASLSHARKFSALEKGPGTDEDGSDGN